MLGTPTWVGVVTDDLEKARAFYRDVLGLEQVREREGYAWFRAGEAIVELARRNADRPELQRAGCAIGYRVDDLETTRAELITRGAQPLTEIQGGPKAGARWCYFRDPEGNTLQITQELSAG